MTTPSSVTHPYMKWAHSYIEARQHEWDQPNEAMLLNLSPLGAVTTVRSVTGGGDMSGVLSELFSQVFTAFAYHGEPLPSFTSIALGFEAWSPPKGMEEEIERRRRVGGSIGRYSELEGRRESRSVLSMDSAGRVCVLSWFRGEDEPETVIGPTELEEPALEGKLFDLLEGAWDLVRATYPQLGRNDFAF